MGAEESPGCAAGNDPRLGLYNPTARDERCSRLLAVSRYRHTRCVLAGSYLKRGERDFWYLKMRQTGVLTIMLKPDAISYDRIMVTCTPEIAQAIAGWWQPAR
jgi:hypothetical protein